MNNKIKQKTTSITIVTTMMTIFALLIIPTSMAYAQIFPELLFEIPVELNTGEAVQPYGITMGTDGFAYVTNYYPGTSLMYTVFDIDGNEITQHFSIGGAYSSQHPGIAMDSNDRMYLGNYPYSTTVFGVNGAPSFIMGVIPDSGGQNLGNVIWVDVDSEDNVYLMDQSYRKIHKYDSNGQHIKSMSITSMSTAGGSIHLDLNDDIYVASPSKIEKFDSNGILIQTFTTPDIATLGGMHVNESGTVYVTAVTKIIVFESDGTYVGDIGSGAFSYAQDVVVDEGTGRVFVTDKTAGKLFIFGEAPELYCNQPESYYDNVIIGTNSTEILTGTSQNDLILGFGGDDSIKGGAGDDCIYGGDGNDVVIANAGNDTIYGGDGNDALFGNKGTDTIFGGEGNDIIWGQSGIDSIDAGDGSDICVAITNDSTISCEITS